jgi:hypothetical protein
MNFRVLDGFAFVTITAGFATPALAGMVVPAPAAGVGIAALALLGFGYRALRKRIDR